MLTPDWIIFWSLNALTLGVCGFAIRFGGKPERIGGSIILANLLLTFIAFAGQGVAWPKVNEIIGLAADGATAVALLVLAVRYASLWLGGAMMFYAAQFSLHSFYSVTDRAPDALYGALNNFNFLAITACLGAGALVAWRRSARSRLA